MQKEVESNFSKSKTKGALKLEQKSAYIYFDQQFSIFSLSGPSNSYVAFSSSCTWVLI